MFRKGMPSLFVSIRGLYADSEKSKIIEEMILGYLKNLKSSQKFDSKSTGNFLLKDRNLTV